MNFRHEVTGPAKFVGHLTFTVKLTFVVPFIRSFKSDQLCILERSVCRCREAPSLGGSTGILLSLTQNRQALVQGADLSGRQG